MPEAKLVAIADINSGKLNVVGNRFNVENRCLDDHKILKRTDVDAVLICTPTNTHAQIAVEAAEAGKHIFCEKPMATNSSEADDMIRAAEKNRVKLMVGHFSRFLPNHRKAKEIMKRGELGDIYYAEAHGEQPIIKPEEGALLDFGVHLIDLLMWYFDDSHVDKVAALLHTSVEGVKRDIGAVLILQFANNILGRIGVFWMANWQSWAAVDRYVKILGTKGKIVSDLTGPSLLLYKEGSLISRLRGPQRIVPKPLRPKLPGTQYAYRKELENFIRCILEDKEPSVTGHQGKAVMRIVDAALQSSEQGRFVKVSN